MVAELQPGHGRATMSDEDIREVFASLGAVAIRRIFSGKGVYVDGVIVAIEYGGELRLKADPISAPEFEAAGATRWSYEGRRGGVAMPYWSIPSEAYDEPDLMAEWVRRALQAGRRAQASKSPAIRRRSGG